MKVSPTTFRPLPCAGLVPLLIVGFVTLPVAGQKAIDEPAARFVQRVNSLYQTFDQNYLQPIVKQQFMLTAVDACYTVGGKQAPAGLRHEASQLANDGDIEKWLTSHWQAALENVDENPDRPLLDQICDRMLRSLDPRSGYVSARQNRVDKQLAENQYVGIGIRVRYEEEKAMIDYPFPGGTAHEAGARVGDFIIEVDGESMAGLDLGVIVERLRGLEGSEVTVEVQNQDGSEPRTLHMVRKVVPIPSVTGVRQKEDGTWRYMPDRNGRYAYMAIASLVGSTSAELQDAVRDVAAEGAKGVVLDLRELNDAELHHINMVADVLVGEGELGTLNLPYGQTRTLMTRADSDFEGLHVAVLTRERVSGPVFALLYALGQRNNTSLIGPATNSGLTCLDRFDLPNDDGAIRHLAYATLVPAGLGDDEESAHLHNRQAGGAGVVRLPVDQELTSGDPLVAARNWLDKQTRQSR
ncbi:MAG: S41 family peptidase [Pirellulaceae bacterium]